MTTRQIRTIGGRDYSTRTCDNCRGTGRKHDATTAEAVYPGPYAGKCSHCRNGLTYIHMPPIEIAEGLAWEAHRAILHRKMQVVDELPEWMS